MSVEAVTFENISPLQDQLGDLYRLGETTEREGAIVEIARAWKFDLSPTPDVENLAELTKAVGPAKELRDNIERVQRVLGTSRDARELAVGWVEDSRLLVSVMRSYMTPDLTLPDYGPVVGVMTGGVRNWMARRTEVMLSMGEESEADGIAGYFHSVILAAGNRAMKLSEGPDVREGWTEADYFEKVVAPELKDFGIEPEVVRVDSKDSDVVMDAAAQAIWAAPERWNLPIAMASNAGAWVQNAGQLRRALRRIPDNRDFDMSGDQFYVLSDAIDVGLTGQESPITHENPFAALGMITRGIEELARHMAEVKR